MVELRLDTREGAFTARENGTPIVPGNPQSSLVYRRIMEEDPARRMPPEHSRKVLTPQQKDILKRWIEQGASWKEHWSFVAPVRPELPEVKTNSWVRNPIDRFILSKLETAGLKPSPEADRRTLIRRLSLDLTGLPPTPDNVDAFIRDQSNDAYDKLVDRLLASPHWGEHRARYWLDAARYADTHGVHIDNYREMWPYRDWVIRAFNRNLAFDRFTVEQLAGDLLPNRTGEQQIATGFNRCNVTTNEGGVIIEEVEAIYAKDRVDTTGTVWLGLTVGCATCHDHKFDPISTKDFYSLTAFFRNTTQNPMDGNLPDTPPVIVVPREEDRVRWDQLKRDEADIKDRIERFEQRVDNTFETWLRSDDRRSMKTPLEPEVQLLGLSIDEQAKLDTSGQTMFLSLPPGVTVGTGPSPDQKALQFGSGASVELPKFDLITADKPFSIATWVYQPKREDRFVVASQTNSQTNNRGWALEIGEFLARSPSFRMTGEGGKSIKIIANFTVQLEPGTWNHLTVTYNGSREEAGLELYVNGKAVPRVLERPREMLARIDGNIQGDSPVRLGGDGKHYFEGGAISDFRVFSRAIRSEEATLWLVLNAARRKQREQLNDTEIEAFRICFLNHRDSNYRELVAKLQSLAAQRHQIRQRGAITHVMQEKSDSKPMAHILFRGQYNQPREEVEANVPSALPQMPAGFPRNRLGFAEWLVSPFNPLTARVTVNRFWQEVFGSGIVRTTEDFGSQGQPPSHPELLDWLAVEFRESGWDVKKFYRLLVTSAAYRQSAIATEEKLSRDPDNRLLSRGPRFRMDAESIRDYALAASGLLVRTIGGPSVKPYQPDGVWEAVAMENSNTRFYKRDNGERLYRRSLYTFWKRSAPPASMEIFNAPTRESCTVRRERTNTPLQALVTLNDTQFIEAARYLAQRAILHSGDSDQQFDFIALHLLARSLEQNERAIVKLTHKSCLNYYDSHPEDAKKLLSVGESGPVETSTPSKLAALTMVASQLMNLDEALNK